MKLLSHKEAKVISNKYEYDTYDEFDIHRDKMKDKGFQITNDKFISGDRWMATYVKYCPLGYDE